MNQQTDMIKVMDVQMEKIKIHGSLKYDGINITTSLSILYSVHTAF